MKTIQISKDPRSNNINIYQSYNNKIGSFDIPAFSEAFDWNGDEVINYFLDVLTDCNYHSERKVIEDAIN